MKDINENFRGEKAAKTAKVPMSDRQNGQTAKSDAKTRKKVTTKPSATTYVTPKQTDVNEFFRKRPPKVF